MDVELDSEDGVFGESDGYRCSWLDEEIGSLNMALVRYCSLFVSSLHKIFLAALLGSLLNHDELY